MAGQSTQGAVSQTGTNHANTTKAAQSIGK